MRVKRNVTVTLEEETARWARVSAARADKSVSQFLGELLEARKREEEGYESARRRALARKPFLKSDARYAGREELHDRTRLR
jgi:hypothetical protein